MTAIGKPRRRPSSAPIRGAVSFGFAILCSITLLFTVAGAVAALVKLNGSTLCHAEVRR